MLNNEKQTKNQPEEQVEDLLTHLSERDLWIVRGGPTSVNVTVGEDDLEEEEPR